MTHIGGFLKPFGKKKLLSPKILEQAASRVGQLAASGITRGGRLPEWGECRDTEIVHSEGWRVQVQLWGPCFAAGVP